MTHVQYDEIKKNDGFKDVGYGPKPTVIVLLKSSNSNLS